jgi:hypothetical protein
MIIFDFFHQLILSAANSVQVIYFDLKYSCLWSSKINSFFKVIDQSDRS